MADYAAKDHPTAVSADRLDTVSHYKKQNFMERNNNIEILRIISMLSIVMHHYAVHGGFTLDPNMISVNKVIVQFLSAGGKLGVDCFVLITGYFTVKSKFKFEKLLKLLFIIFTYSATIYIIALMTGYIDFSIKQAIESFFPVIFNQYWFATSYVLLYVFSPYINSLINSLDRRSHLNLILLLVTIWSIIPTILTANLDFSSIGWFITLYIIAAYIRLYPNYWFDNSRLNMALSLLTYTMILLSIIIFDILGVNVSFFGNHATYFTGMNKLPLLFCAVTLFLWFKNLKVTNNRYVGIVASSMFGVYLIHDNNIVRHWLWIDQFKNNAFFQSKYLVIHAILVIFFVFSSGVLIDQIKKLMLEKPFSGTITKISMICLEKEQYLKSKIHIWANKTFHRTR